MKTNGRSPARTTGSCIWTAGRASSPRTLPADTAVVEYAPLSDAATFTVTFDEDTELTGNMRLRLWVSTTEGTDMDLFVGVEKLNAQGEVVHFHGKAGFTQDPAAIGWLRVSERALDPDRSTPWQPWLSHDDPQPLTPNEVVSVEVEILPSSTLFRAGESLRVVVQGQDLFEHPTLAHDHSGRQPGHPLDPHRSAIRFPSLDPCRSVRKTGHALGATK